MSSSVVQVPQSEGDYQIRPAPDLPPSLDTERMQVNASMLDVGRVLVQAISDLKRIRSELGSGNNELNQLITITETDLQRKAETILSVSADGGMLVREETTTILRTSLVRQPSDRRRGKRRGQRHWVRGGDGQRLSLHRKLLAHPGTDAARAYLQDRYGLGGLETSGTNMRDAGTSRSGILFPHKTTTPNQVIPKEIRDDPRAVPPPEIIDKELHKGLLHLLVKGIIPFNQDLSVALVGDKGAMQARAAPIMRFEAKLKRPPITTALEDHALSSVNKFKMDTITPVHDPPTWDDSIRAADAKHQPATSEADDAQARAYDELMDQYSLHEFLIRRGSTVDSTPEFLSFHRTYSEHWPPIAELILQLEGICVQYAVPLAIINGRQLAELSMRSMGMDGEPVAMEDLLSCVKNIQQVAAVLQQPGRRYKGPGGTEEAAVRIQSVFRGSKTRRELRQLRKEVQAAMEIQQAWGIHRERQKTLGRIMDAKAERESQFQALQKWLADYWEAIEGSQHVVVHISSMSIAPHQKIGLSHLQARQNAQMSRVCDVADPLVDVVYVAPYQLGDDVDGYWNKLLEVGGVSNPGGRCRVIHPENYNRLPQNMNLTAQLLCSPRALKRIRAYVKGRPAYIVPGFVGQDEKDLAVALGLPLLAPHPSTVVALSKKSAARSIFMEAKMNAAPGRAFPPMLQPAGPVALRQRNNIKAGGADPESVVDKSFNSAAVVAWSQKGGAVSPKNRIFKELTAVLAELIVMHPMFSRWIIKIDDAFGGRGHCYIDLVGIRGIEEPLDKLVTAAAARQGLDTNFDGLSADVHALALQKIKDSLARALPSKAVISCRESYPSWSSYVMALGDRGGVIEACPRQVTGSPSANIFIDPTGECSILSSQEQIFCPAYRYVGASFPQSSVPHAALCDAAMAVGGACFQAGIVGHVGVDFVAHREEGRLKLWAVDLNLCCTSTLSNFQLFDFLAAGEMDLRRGAYFVPNDELSDEQRNASSGEAFQQRYFTTVDFLLHRGLSSVQYASFFNKCRLNGLAFDMQDRLGTVFNLMDSFASGVLGIVSVGRSPYESFAELSEVLQFMNSALGSKGMEVETEDQGFKNIYATFKYLAERIRPAEALPQ